MRDFQAGWAAHLSRWVTHYKVLWGEISVPMSIGLSQPCINTLEEEDVKHWAPQALVSRSCVTARKIHSNKSLVLTPSFFSLHCLGEFSVTTIQCTLLLVAWIGREGYPKCQGQMFVLPHQKHCKSVLWDTVCLLGLRNLQRCRKRKSREECWYKCPTKWRLKERSWILNAIQLICVFFAFFSNKKIKKKEKEKKVKKKWFLRRKSYQMTGTLG